MTALLVVAALAALAVWAVASVVVGVLVGGVVRLRDRQRPDDEQGP